MKIELYSYSGKVNTIEKDLGIATEKDGYIKGDCNILAPIIKLTGTDLFNFNYCYIPIFNRYYFIDDCTILSNGVSVITLSIDVLKTYSTAILASYANIKESENPNVNKIDADFNDDVNKIEYDFNDVFNDSSIILTGIYNGN